jgi:hypothetical protein
MMLRCRLRPFIAGLFAIWFAALGVTRGTYMACLDHRAEHQAAGASAVGAASTDLHAGHDAHAGHGAAHGGAGPAMASGSGDETPDEPQHCTCAGDCCSAVPPQSLPRTSIACAPEARVAPRLPDIAQTARPFEFVPHVLPFATAPPAAALAV